MKFRVYHLLLISLVLWVFICLAGYGILGAIAP